MKSIKFLFVLLVIAAFAIPQETNAQAIVIKDGVKTLFLYGESVASTSAMDVITPSGNITRIIVWHLNPDNPNLPEKGVEKILIGGEGLIDTKVLVYPDGKVKLVTHLNGSGNITPNPGNK